MEKRRRQCRRRFWSRGQGCKPTRPTPYRLPHHLASSAEARDGSDRAQAMCRWWWHAAAAPAPLPLERAAMGMRSPRLEIDVRVSRWVTEEVVEDREPGAQAVG